MRKKYNNKESKEIKEKAIGENMENNCSLSKVSNMR
jgi:hypothetical protein